MTASLWAAECEVSHAQLLHNKQLATNRAYVVRTWHPDLSLWCGPQHFQIILNLRRCPLFQFRLRPYDRVMYCSGVWSYIVGAVTTFTFLLIPLLTIWIGALPTFVRFEPSAFLAWADLSHWQPPHFHL